MARRVEDLRTGTDAGQPQMATAARIAVEALLAEARRRMHPRKSTAWRLAKKIAVEHGIEHHTDWRTHGH
jgi:hypothetical protein